MQNLGVMLRSSCLQSSVGADAGGAAWNPSRIHSVLVWKLDRFGRSLRHLVNAQVGPESVGAAFISLKDSLDLSTPAGRLMFGVNRQPVWFNFARLSPFCRAAGWDPKSTRKIPVISG